MRNEGKGLREETLGGSPGGREEVPMEHTRRDREVIGSREGRGTPYSGGSRKRSLSVASGGERFSGYIKNFPYCQKKPGEGGERDRFRTTYTRVNEHRLSEDAFRLAGGTVVGHAHHVGGFYTASSPNNFRKVMGREKGRRWRFLLTPPAVADGLHD